MGSVVVVPDTVVKPEQQPARVDVPETPIEAQILEMAADILETEGWTKGNYSTWGNRCAVGGIGAAVRRLGLTSKSRERRNAERALAALVRSPNRLGYGDKQAIIAWNDDSKRKKDQVIRKMREAAARLMPKL